MPEKWKNLLFHNWKWFLWVDTRAAVEAGEKPQTYTHIGIDSNVSQYSEARVSERTENLLPHIVRHSFSRSLSCLYLKWLILRLTTRALLEFIKKMRANLPELVGRCLKPQKKYFELWSEFIDAILFPTSLLIDFWFFFALLIISCFTGI